MSRLVVAIVCAYLLAALWAGLAVATVTVGGSHQLDGPTAAISASAALMWLIMALPQEHEALPDQCPVGLCRRFLAGLIDLLTIGSIVPLLLLLRFSSGKHSVVAWAFLTLAALAVPLALFCYLWLLPKFGRATIGQYLCGYRIEADGAKAPSYARRALAAAGASAFWPWIIIAAMREPAPGSYWWDRYSGSRAVSCRSETWAGFSDHPPR